MNANGDTSKSVVPSDSINTVLDAHLSFIYDSSDKTKLPLLFLPGSVIFTDWLAGRAAHRSATELGMLICAIALGRATIAARKPFVRCKEIIIIRCQTPHAEFTREHASARCQLRKTDSILHKKVSPSDVVERTQYGSGAGGINEIYRREHQKVWVLTIQIPGRSLANRRTAWEL